MTFDCTQCLPKCHADCCRGPVPMREEWAARQTPIRPVVLRQDLGNGWVSLVAVDESTRNEKDNSIMGLCPFLGLDNRCSVYHDRPEVCRAFGSESDAFMVCSYQDSTGRVRSRQERRRVEMGFAKRDKMLEGLK